jgi:hypothetical protein
MPATVDVEELHTTKSEKLLALVLVVFLLIGGVWTYQEIDDRVRTSIELGGPTAAEQAAIDRAQSAQLALGNAQNRETKARDDVVFAREEFRAALDADEPSVVLERRYREAQRELVAAQAARRAAQQAVDRSAPAAGRAQSAVSSRIEDRQNRQELVTFLLRLALVLVALAVGYVALARLRERNSRYLPLAGSILVFGTVMAFGLAGDYLTDYFNPLDAGLLILSVIGVLATLGAFWALQRYLARRLPHRRVRKGECPFCAFPVRGNERCEGCGRAVIAPCSTCERTRRVGAVFCGSCGAA